MTGDDTTGPSVPLLSTAGMVGSISATSGDTLAADTALLETFEWSTGEDGLPVLTFDAPVTVSNSAALLASPVTHADWVRPGIMLYGGSPFDVRSAASLVIKSCGTSRTVLEMIRASGAEPNIVEYLKWVLSGSP